MNDVPDRIWIQSDTKNHLSELRELEVQPISDVLSAFTEWLSRTYHNALVAESYEVASLVPMERLARGDSTAPVSIGSAIQRLTPALAIAAREARDKQVREQTLRDAIERISSDARYTLDGVSEYEARIICDKLRHMIEKDQTNDG